MCLFLHMLFLFLLLLDNLHLCFVLPLFRFFHIYFLLGMLLLPIHYFLTYDFLALLSMLLGLSSPARHSACAVNA